ncbi:hypothetical protein [Acidocella facilis]|jgi:hypothetical protein|uniref:hypothetical protein n=1 Tax=Acidocella facilis TaxID=525 RepID=UPI001F34D4A8|nr:hypothetical protein [Acidocella facilis]
MKAEVTEQAGARRHNVVEAAKAEGLFAGDNSALGARIPRRLITRAKERSGITSTTDLVEYALAKVALEDDFGARLVARKGTIPVDLKLDV